MDYTPPHNALQGQESNPNRGYWDANPTGATEAERDGAAIPAAALEAPQREIINVIEGAGIEPAAASNEQLLAAINTLINNASTSIELASKAEAEEGTENTKVMTALRVKEAIAALAPPASKVFNSTGQNIVYGGVVNIAHDLTVMPDFVTGYIECVSATDGYAVGDRLELGTLQNDTTSSVGVAIIPDASNILVMFAVSGFRALHKSSQGGVDINANTSWKLYIKAVRL